MACNYNNIEFPLSKISELEQLRNDIIDALNYVGVTCPPNTSFHELPDYILKIGGTDTTGWPLDLEELGYDYEDERRASYRYMLSFMIDADDNVKKSHLDLQDLIYTAMTVEVPKSLEVAEYWNSLSSEEQAAKHSLCYQWDGAFFPYIDTSNATTMTNWFLGASKLVHIPTLNTTNVTSAGGMFAFNTVCLHEWPEFDLRNVIECESIYYNGSGNAYICGLKNLGRDPSIGEVHAMGSIYAILMFFAIGSGAWWNPCHGGIISYPMYLFNPRRTGITAGYDMNIMSCEGFFRYRGDINIGSSPNISYNSLYNLITSLDDIAEWDVNPVFSVSRSLHDNSDVWDYPTFDDMITGSKGWTLNIYD